MSLIPPKTLASLKNLALLSRTVVDGFMMGVQKSVQKGAGMEFSQYRSYQPGDDLRQLDWKLFARSDRYYIREAETENSITVRFVLDASASMHHEDHGISKMQYARWLAAALAYLAHRQGDAVGLFALRKGDVVSLTPRRDAQHLQRLFYQLENLHPGGTFPGKAEAAKLLVAESGRELTVFITDLYESENEISRLAGQLKAHRNEVILFHLMAPNELTLDYGGQVTLEDWETGQAVEVAADGLRPAYLQALQSHLEAVRRRMLETDVFYRLQPTDQPLDDALRAFLRERNGRMG
jgi:uncharacterized protein (DUF58 family)